MSSLAALNERFGIPGHVAFSAGPSALVIIEVDNALGNARILLQGAQVVHWAPTAAKPVIWTSEAAKYTPGKSLRGGVPVCWPWFGPHATNAEFPAHGFARTRDWDVVSTRQLASGATELVLRLPMVDSDRVMWPEVTSLEFRVTVGDTLEMLMANRNHGTNPVTIGQALHTYFAVSDVRQCRISGLENVDYVDKVDARKTKRQQGAVAISSEVDRVYVNTAGDCVIDDPGWQRRIRISKRGSAATVVWNPWEEKAARFGDMSDNGYLSMVCVESANAEQDVVTLAPNEEHQMWVRYQLESV